MYKAFETKTQIIPLLVVHINNYFNFNPIFNHYV